MALIVDADSGAVLRYVGIEDCAFDQWFGHRSVATTGSSELLAMVALVMVRVAELFMSAMAPPTLPVGATEPLGARLPEKVLLMISTAPALFM